MTLAFPQALLQDWLDAITARADAGAGAALLRVYDGVRPAAGAAITTENLLTEAVCDDPFAPPASASPANLNPTLPVSVNNIADGTATWFRVVDSSFNWVMDGTVGDDMTISNPVLVTGEPFDVTSWLIVAPNGG